MWVKIEPDMSLNMDIEITGIDEYTRDGDVQLYEEMIAEALRERLRSAFSDEDIALRGVKAGIAREKYIDKKAA